MATNVSFKRGAQGSLPTSNFTEGAFYLTNDTDRLYFAQSSSELVLLNQTVQIVNAVADLPKTAEINDFFYCKTENILAVYTEIDSVKQWKQINPDTDTNTDTTVTGLDNTVTVNADNIIITFTLDQTTTNEIDSSTTALPQKSTTITIPIANIIEGGLGLDQEVAGNTSTNSANIYITAKDEKQGDGFNIIGGNNVQISTNNNDITIAATDTTYGISTETGTANESVKVKLENNLLSSSDDITLKRGNTDILVNTDANDNISIAHNTISKTDKTSTPTLKKGDTFTAINSIVTSTTGHVTEVNTATYKLPQPVISSLSHSNEGRTTLTFKDANDDSQWSTFTTGQELYHTVEGETIYNQGALPVYNTDTIDTKLEELEDKIQEANRSLNAVRYKGTVDTSGSLPTANVETGDLYMVNTTGNEFTVLESGIYEASGTNTTKKVSCESGDLLIAVGPENDNGILTTVYWVYVPSGDDIDTQYNLKLSGNTIQLYNKVSSSVDSESDTVTISGDNEIITIASSGTSPAKTLTVNHKTYSQPTVGTDDDITVPTAGNQSFTYINGVTTDGYGHLTGCTTQKVTIPTYDTYDLTLSDNNNIKLIKTNTGNSESEELASVTLTSGNDAISVTTNVADVNNSTTTITHKTSNVGTGSSDTKVATHGSAITHVDSIIVDSYGHVTGFNTKTTTLPETPVLSGGLSLSEGIATVTNTLTDDNSQTSSTTFGITSSSLELTESNSVLAMNLVWGSF